MLIQKPTTCLAKTSVLKMVPRIPSQCWHGEVHLCRTFNPTKASTSNSSKYSKPLLHPLLAHPSKYQFHLPVLKRTGGGLTIFRNDKKLHEIINITNSSSSMAHTFLHGSKILSGSNWRGVIDSSATTMSKHSQNLLCSLEPLLAKLWQICGVYILYAWFSTYLSCLHLNCLLNKFTTFARMLQALEDVPWRASCTAAPESFPEIQA